MVYIAINVQEKIIFPTGQPDKTCFIFSTFLAQPLSKRFYMAALRMGPILMKLVIDSIIK